VTAQAYQGNRAATIERIRFNVQRCIRSPIRPFCILADKVVVMQYENDKSPQNRPAYYVISLVALFIFGFFYNRYVAKLEAEGREQGKTSILVIFGTGITLIPVRLQLGKRPFWYTVGLFCASGFWMVAGSIWRYLQELTDIDRANKKLLQSIDRITNA